MTNEPSPSNAVSKVTKAILIVALAIFLWQQAVTLLGPGGIMSKYTFMEGFTKFDDVMLDDPLSKAGFIDMMVLMAFLIVVLVNGVPRGKYYPLIAGALVVAGIVYPGLAALLFLILYWRRSGQFRPE